jgi:protease I
MTPMARRVANGKKDRFVVGASPGKRFIAPGIPVDRIIGVLQQIGTALMRETIHRRIMSLGSAHFRSSISLRYNPPMSTEATLAGKRVAIFVEDEFEDREVTGPLDALRAAGATVSLVGPSAGAEYKGKRGHATVKADVSAGSVKPGDFDALVIPGGHAPDKMRMRHAMVDLARDAMESGKPVAAICHGQQVLISANVLRGRTLTCWPSIAIDVKNAGGLYVDKPVVEDGNLITSRKPDDVPMFSEAIIKALTKS